ncbi:MULTISPECIES: GNAT family N-acetyltransferase [Bacillus]|uniref:GNAT family N-acetyltransferase n=1 Tax=Bacillus TaxID=1386 RepID=UPI00054E98FD|nr:MULTISPECIES: GNAT family N-acetyltransferase [Bacillus]
MKVNDFEKISIKEFEEGDKGEWDEFIDCSKNGTFIHKIDYLHYHLDRFKDCSLIVKKKNRVVALMPGNIEGSTFYTHKGLTYAGLLILPETKIGEVIMCFNMINHYLKEKKQIRKVIYRSIPYIYSSIPSQEDEYVLFLLEAKLISSGLSSVICKDERIPFTSLRKRGIKKAKRNELEIRTDSCYEDFWRVLTENLNKKHNTNPIHTLSEIQKLNSLFKENIQLFSVYYKNECIAGVVMYISKNVAHVQYISASDKGKQMSALDYLFNYLINQVFINKMYFDFGTSVENNGFNLNEGLVFQKQGFGARCVLYQQFEYDVNRTLVLSKEVQKI